ncbi:ABC-F family ATP-binding cassette domain-containing protein [Dermatophilus congolensis]|uniref:ABC-F family ATP-binding cassette domain-containing protein n=1 Tax=Dermatophilus congolensis TaxID=1863 RepID=UPI001AAF494A|nr:ABC-F family ATP-binding cassette domain-containing protein [Dermatophilus congolensis]MBO3129901.1 ABC-F family ATP-binding cassette domain-containing protein [Dermatophilus congolensis]MBO3131469.1 ABC-F family ATP-binding cassette domain-containing protein [Dermatophilus congolensis]MBO3134375.1 ABC-F family ATP-binding cassette domain-containing protein [Dermatophilus congolensis]MBO3136610.1 ABC-F family ATP-binding cassette domain-containing protein [Dermatophilus congolensis]MBO31388
MNQPSNLVSVEKASVTLGLQVLLDDVSLGILDGDRIGVVGRNGGGKSTLMRVIAGKLAVDSGRITRNNDLTVGMLDQADVLDPQATVRDVVLGDLPEHEWAGSGRIRDVLVGLLGGLDAAAMGGWDAVVGPMSGGERRRLALARLLVADPDLLLLDEPTNHLDVEGVAWLANHLAVHRPRSGSALVVVTHDRWFLDAVSTMTWEVVGGHVDIYEGGYAAFVLSKAERERAAAVAAQKRDNLLRKELAWLRRGAPARTSKPKFRLDAASELIADEPPPRDEVKLTRFAATRLGKDVVDLENASLGFGDRPILDNVTWRLAPGARIGIVGVNGAGKSTLMRVVSGDVPLDGGKRKQGKTVVFGYLSQEVRELDRLADARVVEAVAEVRQYIQLGDKEISASQLAQRLGFSPTRQRDRVGELSGGERRRLQLTRLLMTEPNVLILDEPTNDLDIETLTSLEDLLDGWVGTLLVVSHDRYLLERVTDSQVALYGDGKIRDLPGGVEEYLRRREEMERSEAARAQRGAAPVEVAEDVPAVSGAQAREIRKEMSKIERRLGRIAQEKEKIHDQMAVKATDVGALAELASALRALEDEELSLEERWLEVSELVQ